MAYSPRHGRQQADQAIKKDVVRGLVELITNADDAYKRLEGVGERTVGRIVIAVRWRGQRISELSVIDFAEGMTPQKLDESLGVYADEGSGFREGKLVRGFFGRGLKDAILGLGSGEILTIRNGILSQASLRMQDEGAWYQGEEPIVAKFDDRERVFLGQKHEYNGTQVTIQLTRDDVKTASKENLKQALETHCSLRDIMVNPARSVELWVLPANKKSRLTYSDPVCAWRQDIDEEVLYDEGKFQVTFTICSSAGPLPAPNEVGPYAAGGFLVSANHAAGQSIVFENQMFGLEHYLGSDHFYGRVDCPHLVELLKSDDTLVLATRDGLDWTHKFNAALKNTIRRVLEPIIKENEQRIKAADREIRDSMYKERIRSVVTGLNEIAVTELSEVYDSGKTARHPKIPETGFGFVPPFYQILYRKEAHLLIRGRVPDVVEAGDYVKVESDKPEVVVKSSLVALESRDAWPDIAEAKVVVEGVQIGAQAEITASIGDLRESALVEVIGKRDKPSPPSQPIPNSGGLIRDIVFLKDADPRLRVRYYDGDIRIATSSGSVAPYLDEKGTLLSRPESQVLLAELITEAVCQEIARRGVHNGRFIAPPGGEVDAIQREFRRLQNHYAPKIHELVVDPKARRDLSDTSKKGRPSTAELRDKAVFPLE